MYRQSAPEIPEIAIPKGRYCRRCALPVPGRLEIAGRAGCEDVIAPTQSKIRPLISGQFD